MRFINAFDGRDVKVGETFLDPNLSSDGPVPVRLVQAEVGLLWARLYVQRPGTSRIVAVPGTVRYTHPSYFLQKVVFIET